MNRIRLFLHAFFSVRCSRYIVKLNKKYSDKSIKLDTWGKKDCSYWFKFCSYWEFKLRDKRYRTTITDIKITRQEKS